MLWGHRPYATSANVDAPTGVMLPNLAQLSGSYSDVGVDSSIANAQIICPGQTVASSVTEISDQEDVYRILLAANQQFALR